jgi:hypothetical protein
MFFGLEINCNINHNTEYYLSGELHVVGLIINRDVIISVI